MKEWKLNLYSIQIAFLYSIGRQSVLPSYLTHSPKPNPNLGGFAGKNLPLGNFTGGGGGGGAFPVWGGYWGGGRGNFPIMMGILQGAIFRAQFKQCSSNKN